MKLLMLKGLPASGKTTYAKRIVAKSREKNTKWIRVNKDDLRAMLHASIWSKENEREVLAIRDHIIKESLYNGHNVVVDDTNFNPVHEEQLRKLAQRYSADFEVKFIEVPIEKCIKRDLERPNSVGEAVIRKMYNEYLAPVKTAAVYKPPKDAPTAILIDIDGTLAHHHDRSPFDWSRVGEDTLDKVVADIVNHYYRTGRDLMSESPNPSIILLSGRDGSCRDLTEKWLADNNVQYDHLFMRPANDNRKDFIVKREIFDQNIKDKYNVLFILDDRNQVVEMWRSMGIKVLQVAEGDF